MLFGLTDGLEINVEDHMVVTILHSKKKCRVGGTLFAVNTKKSANWHTGSFWKKRRDRTCFQGRDFGTNTWVFVLDRRLFTKHPELAEPYDADGIDPDSLGHSQKFVMYGMSELQYFFKLPESLENDRKWRSALSNFKEHYSDVGVPLDSFNKVTDAFLAAMEKNAGGVSAEQKKNWEELLKKAYDDMKSWKWF
ncbi:GLOBIN domain-containing protein [Aphelenchoides besseyi]|nr:GLOBIN domain-containing protein [Aphelenchoides besseyi]